jgi:hypothetical protein
MGLPSRVAKRHFLVPFHFAFLQVIFIYGPFVKSYLMNWFNSNNCLDFEGFLYRNPGRRSLVYEVEMSFELCWVIVILNQDFLLSIQNCAHACFHLQIMKCRGGDAAHQARREKR